MAQLTGTNEDVGSDLQGDLGDGITGVIVDGSEQTAQLLRLEDRRVMVGPGCHQSPLEHAGRVNLATSCGHPVPEDAPRE